MGGQRQARCGRCSINMFRPAPLCRNPRPWTRRRKFLVPVGLSVLGVQTRPESSCTVAPRSQRLSTPWHFDTRAQPAIHHPATTYRIRHINDLRRAPAVVVFVVVVDKTGHVSWPAALPDVSDTRYDSWPARPPYVSNTRRVSWHVPSPYVSDNTHDCRRFLGLPSG